MPLDNITGHLSQNNLLIFWLLLQVDVSPYFRCSCSSGRKKRARTFLSFLHIFISRIIIEYKLKDMWFVCYFFYYSMLLFQKWRMRKFGCLCIEAIRGSFDSLLPVASGITTTPVYCDECIRSSEYIKMKATIITRQQASLNLEYLSMEQYSQQQQFHKHSQQISW